MKKILTGFCLILTFSLCFSQKEEIQLYKNIIAKSDSLISIGKIKETDTINLFKAAAKIDKKHPTQYFDVMATYLSENKFNEASFLFYLGIIRYKFYNSANPKYKAGDDGALLASLQVVLGEPINLYVRSDADNFVNILNLVKHYYQNNDYKFFTKKNNESKYNDQIKYLDNLIDSIEKDKSALTEEWKKEREDFKQTLRSL